MAAPGEQMLLGHTLRKLAAFFAAPARMTCAGGVAWTGAEQHHWNDGHWSNLLLSPMDARHYVLEDWCTPDLALGRAH
jgi:hypothetical protein